MKKKKKSLKLFTPMEIVDFGRLIKGKEQDLFDRFRSPPSHRLRVNIVANFFNTIQFHHFNDEKRLYWYVDNIYQIVDKISIQNLVKRIFTVVNWPDYIINAGNEVYRQIYADSIIPLDKINCEEDILPFRNGLFDLKSKKFLGPRPDIYFTRYFSVNYTDSTSCPKFKKFLKQILPYDMPREMILTYLAYCLTPRCDIEMTQFWTGGGNNGKSTLADIISLLMNSSVSHVRRQRLLNPNDRFSLAFLEDKLINFCSEVSSGNRMGSEACAGFKRLTDKYQHGENKGDDQMEWFNTVKLIFLMNDLPLKTNYMDYATFRRMQIIPFTIIIPPEDIITGLADILFKGEGPQIAAYILSFYPKIKKVIKQNVNLAQEMWVRNTNTVFQFADFFCDINTLHTNYISPVYDNYVDWCAAVKKKPVVIKSFIHLLTSLKMVKHQEKDYESRKITTTYGIECNRKNGKIDGIYEEIPMELVS